MKARTRVKRAGSPRAGRKTLGYQTLVGRIFASILLPAGLLVICLWAPLALANDSGTAGAGEQSAAQQTGSSDTVSATNDSGATGSTTSGSGLTSGETTGIINTTDKVSDNSGGPAGGGAQATVANSATTSTSTSNGSDCPDCGGGSNNSASNEVYDPNLNHYEYDL